MMLKFYLIPKTLHMQFQYFLLTQQRERIIMKQFNLQKNLPTNVIGHCSNPKLYMHRHTHS